MRRKSSRKRYAMSALRQRQWDCAWHNGFSRFTVRSVRAIPPLVAKVWSAVATLMQMSTLDGSQRKAPSRFVNAFPKHLREATMQRPFLFLTALLLAFSALLRGQAAEPLPPEKSAQL